MRGQALRRADQAGRMRDEEYAAKLQRAEQQRQREMQNRNALAEIYTRAMGSDAGDVIRYGGTAANANTMYEMANPSASDSMFGKVIYKVHPETRKTHAWQMSKSGTLLDLGAIDEKLMIQDMGGYHRYGDPRTGQEVFPQQQRMQKQGFGIQSPQQGGQRNSFGFFSPLEMEGQQQMQPAQQQGIREMKGLSPEKDPAYIKDIEEQKLESKSYAEKLIKFPKSKEKALQALEDASFYKQKIQSTIDQSSGWNTGWMEWTKMFPETSGKSLAGKISTLQAFLGFGKLQEMRDNSPTGGALGQVSERELSFLQDSLAKLDPAMGEKEFDAILSEIMAYTFGGDITSGGTTKTYEGRESRVKRAFEQDFGISLDDAKAGKKYSPQRIPSQPGGEVDATTLKELSNEEAQELQRMIDAGVIK